MHSNNQTSRLTKNIEAYEKIAKNKEFKYLLFFTLKFLIHGFSF